MEYVEFEVRGLYALFSDPVTRVGGEKFSYPIPTYEAIKGVLHSIYWKPSFIWVVDDIRIMNPIQTETKGTLLIKYQKDEKDLAYYTYLKDCRYQVRAHLTWNFNRPELECDRNFGKHMEIAKRAIKKGGRRDIFLGTRECQADVSPCVFGEGEGFYDKIPEVSYGIMYHGMTYPDEAYSKETRGKLTTRLWRAKMEYGVVHFIPPKDCIHRSIREMNMKLFSAEDINPVDKEEKEVSDELD